ncbi:peptide MFS transporter [Aquimarina agarilytica]|uniref:peptide MFS transporter n=1 Tax=Aquimarina agarilytica TaxID=1087449 RepID=UPI000289617F|nr:peptide MFS transporter [Aquimarina agarilytica]
MLYGGSEVNQKLVLGHPSGLFVMFFTEMWERFSYYGMRALLVLFLVTSVIDNGWGWERGEALVLYGWYTGLVYLTPMLGGFVADKFLGFKKAVVLGAFLMTLGHASMALEVFSNVFFFMGLGLIILGNGFFKPNIASIVGQLYTKVPEKRDAGFTIFYMGVNAGAFLGILLCGYIGEKVGWHYGFSLAGIFMFFGMLQFYFAQGIFGKIGEFNKDIEDVDDAVEDAIDEVKEDVEEVIEKISKSKVVKDRLVVIGIFTFFTIFFWWAFEQAGGSMTVFAKDYTNRVLEGGGALTFKVFNTILTVVPMMIITWVLSLLFRQTFSKYALSNILLGTSFVIVWGFVIWMLIREFSNEVTEVPASWFSILNSFYIIVFAPFFSKIWESKYNPTGPVKFAIGLILLGIGFAVLSFGSMNIPLNAKSASVSMVFLVLAYFFHTMGELCVSPVGTSYVSKLAPIKFLGLMFGVWYFSSFIANLMAGITGSYLDPIVESYGMSFFFMIFTIIPCVAGLTMLVLNKTIIKLMHGIR